MDRDRAAQGSWPAFPHGTSEAGKDSARTAVARKFDLIEAQLEDGREWLVAGQFSVADAYLFAVSNWANFTGIDLARWPNLAAFVSRGAKRPSAQAAMRAEGLI
ncbi:glutathione binding-like protein [Cribrihabitans neustonicus]|uniref:glutathione binding-like protein n=1 Tax=Cribrihabitans neustonicus TaxID=1429085 RepID=UPI003B5B0364